MSSNANILFISFSSAEWTAILLSLKIAGISTITAFPFALMIGWLLGRKMFIGKPVIEGFLHLPLVMPPVTTGYLLLLLLGTQSLIGSWLYRNFGIRLAFNQTAAVIAAIVVSFPLMTRSIRTSIEMVDQRMEAASKTLGISPFLTFFRITFPLALPGILSGIVLGFARALGEFGATITFAGNIEGETRTIPMAVYTYMQIPGNENATFRLVIISAIISLIAMILAEYLNKKTKGKHIK
ncbi:MAG: molybdate ABC transporter permease subunit [Bacteroidales bacterium]|jgi:molybdate transport system permease protein